MGAVGAAFGRNLAPDYRPETFDHPNPVLVSEQLLKRDHFIPATSLNLLAAAWIQFQVHDWVNHARHPLGVDDVVVPMPGGQKWRNTRDGKPENLMRIAGNQALAVDPDGTQRLFADAASHWWDASEVYGTDRAKANSLREGAKIRLDDGYLPEDVSGMEVTGFNESWWLGLSGTAHAVRPRAQRPLRRAARPLPRVERRTRLPDRAADRGRADREDPHGRVDAGDPGHRGDRPRAEGELERPAGQRLAHPARHLADGHPCRVSASR